MINTHAVAWATWATSLLARDLSKRTITATGAGCSSGVDADLGVGAARYVGRLRSNEVLYAVRLMVAAQLHRMVTPGRRGGQLSLEMDQYRLAEIVKCWKRMASAAYTTDAHRGASGRCWRKAEASWQKR